MAVTLLSCPLCGGDAHFVQTTFLGSPWSRWGYDALGVSVACRLCGCTIPSRMYEGDAAADWNKRSREKASMRLVEAGGLWECSLCGKTFRGVHKGDGIGTAPRFCPNCGAEREAR